MKKGIQTPKAQGPSTKVISMIEWIQTSRLSIKNFFSAGTDRVADAGEGLLSRDQLVQRQRERPDVGREGQGRALDEVLCNQNLGLGSGFSI